MREIHLAGAYGIPEILKYNQDRVKTSWNYPRYFPFWQIAPGAELRAFGEAAPNPNAILVVINLNSKMWDAIREALPQYQRKILIQLEGYKAWEVAYENANCFDRLINFDPNYAGHPGYQDIRLPYIPGLPSSHRDKRGLEALLTQWRYSGRAFLDVYGLRYAPRKKKAILIATLQKKLEVKDRYSNRLDVARRWQDWVDVYGAGWPKDLKSYRGLCVSKADVMRRYRYALVMENQRQPGYISEKIMDCYLTGTVPLYWGAPDAARLVPADTFIPIEEDTQLDRLIADDQLYKKYAQAVRRSTDEIFRAFGPEAFIHTLEGVFAKELAENAG
jgi:hypothetical protein